MTAVARNKAFLIVESLLCVLAAGLLAAGVLSLYLEGSAAPTEGGVFSYVFTREKVGARLLPALPVLLCAFCLSLAGRILGIRDESADRPVRDEFMLRSLGGVRERAVHRQADRTVRVLRAAVLAAAIVLIVLGILNGGLYDVLAKGAVVCSECIGLG